MTEYVDENWTDQLRSGLGKKSLLNWWIEYDPQSTHQLKGDLSGVIITLNCVICGRLNLSSKV